MKQFARVAGFVVLLVVFITGCDAQKGFPVLKGPYLGQRLPGLTPEMFAPGIVSTGMFTRDIAMTPDGTELYFCSVVGQYTYSAIIVTRLVGERWTSPEVAPFSADPSSKTIEPCISPDGKRFFFASNRRTAGKEPSDSDFDVWVMERTAEGWGEPYNLGSPVNTAEGEYFPSVTNDGTLYFTRSRRDGSNDIYRSRFINGSYTEPQKLPDRVNCGRAQYNAFIAPDESYIIVPVFGREDSRGQTDYYIVFRNSDDTWSEPVNMGETINTKANEEYSPFVSRDGKYFFFMSPGRNSDAFRPGEQMTYTKLLELHNRPGSGNPSVYWVDAKIIENLKPKGVR